MLKPRAHTKYLIQAVGAIVHAQWVRNGLWRGSVLSKIPISEGKSRGTFLASNITQVAVISRWNDSYEPMRPKGHVTVTHLVAVISRGHDRYAMGPKQSLEGVIFGLKSPCLRGVQLHVLGLQRHPSGCNFWMEWFLWINGA